MERFGEVSRRKVYPCLLLLKSKECSKQGRSMYTLILPSCTTVLKDAAMAFSEFELHGIFKDSGDCFLEGSLKNWFKFSMGISRARKSLVKGERFVR